MPDNILIATTNQGKVEEIQDLVKGLPVKFLSLSDMSGIPEVVEDGATFEENALKKARVIAFSTQMVTLADDSGLCVDALDGRPGVLPRGTQVKTRPTKKNTRESSTRCRTFRTLDVRLDLSAPWLWWRPMEKKNSFGVYARDE